MVEWSDVLGRYLLVSDDLTMTACWNHLATVERAESLPGDSWDGRWFAEDYCEGPGQALIVNPRGEVKPCCGFASDLDQLTIGNIYRDTVAEIIAFAPEASRRRHGLPEGLRAIRDEILARDPDALPGATSNHCYFCWYILAKGVYAQATERAELLPEHGGSQWAKIVAEKGKVSLPMLSNVPLRPCAGGGNGPKT